MEKSLQLLVSGSEAQLICKCAERISRAYEEKRIVKDDEMINNISTMLEKISPIKEPNWVELSPDEILSIQEVLTFHHPNAEETFVAELCLNSIIFVLYRAIL